MARFDSEQRAKILAAAIPIFAEKGHEGASIRDVGQAAGVNSALLYYYFENKHTLFVEAVRQVLLGFLDQLMERRQEFASGSDRIAFLVNGILDYYGAHPPRMRLMAATIVQHTEVLGQVISSLLKEKTVFPLQILQDGMARGEIRPANPVQVWWSILGACMFSLQMREVFKNADLGGTPFPIPPPELARRQIIELLSGGLAVAPGKRTTKSRGSK